jgi:DNA gyrase subunit A
MDEGESVMGMVLPGDYSGYMIFFFENGKAAKVELSAYRTTSNRRRLSDKSPLKALLHLKEDREIAVYSTEPRVLIVNTALLGVKTTRTTQGVALLTLKKKYVLDTVRFPEETGITDLARYRGRSIPATGALLKTEDSDDKQLSLI